jgi:hypothetical protein
MTKQLLSRARRRRALAREANVYLVIIAGPARHEETILTAEVDLTKVRTERNRFDPVGHYHRPDIFRLAVDTRPRPAVVELEAFGDETNQK